MTCVFVVLYSMYVYVLCSMLGVGECIVWCLKLGVGVCFLLYVGCRCRCMCVVFYTRCRFMCCFVHRV